jgi:hypothetical protein
MANSNEPNKKTVHIGSPPDVVAKPPSTDPPRRETVRIQLPPRPPLDKTALRPTVASPPPITLSQLRAPPTPVPVVSELDSLSFEAKKETARIAIAPAANNEPPRIPLVPEPPPKPLPTVQMKKTQPLIPMPEAAARSASIATAPVQESTTISMPLCWTLLGVSAIILIIQIWMYFS